MTSLLGANEKGLKRPSLPPSRIATVSLPRLRQPISQSGVAARRRPRSRLSVSRRPSLRSFDLRPRSASDSVRRQQRYRQLLHSLASLTCSLGSTLAFQ